MTTVIRDFWLSHRSYWISVGANQGINDKTIYDMFYKYDYSGEDALGRIIYLDQFMRHFSRIDGSISEGDILKCRMSAINIVKNMESDILLVDSKELVWYLMPFKHLHEWDFLFQTIHKWLSRRGPITEFSDLNRYFMDSYKKAFNPEAIIPVCTDGAAEPYDISICESVNMPVSCLSIGIGSRIGECSELISEFNVTNKSVAVSLSGGVDSMLMTYLLKLSGVDVVAVHIIYGNRAESKEEFKFIKTFCQKLDIPLYYYAIKWLQRDFVDRAFYEKMTRDIRFSVYKAIGLPVFLGHIQEDVIENIWTNIAHGTHLDNLAKLERVVVESGVTVVRPWLNIKKELIYKVAAQYSIPHLKNTTPSWSNRGKFRERFYAATHEQYGDSVDIKLLEVAARIKMQAALLDKLLFQDIRATWDPILRRINVTKAISVGLDADGWLHILTDLAHNKLGVSKPSYAACEEMVRRVNKGLKDGDILTLKKNFALRIAIVDDFIFLESMT